MSAHKLLPDELYTYFDDVLLNKKDLLLTNSERSWINIEGKKILKVAVKQVIEVSKKVV